MCGVPKPADDQAVGGYAAWVGTTRVVPDGWEVLELEPEPEIYSNQRSSPPEKQPQTAIPVAKRGIAKGKAHSSAVPKNTFFALGSLLWKGKRASMVRVPGRAGACWCQLRLQDWDGPVT